MLGNAFEADEKKWAEIAECSSQGTGTVNAGEGPLGYSCNTH